MNKYDDVRSSINPALPNVALPSVSDTPVSVALTTLATDNANLVAEIKLLREETKAQAIALVQAAAATAKILARWEGDGMPEPRITDGDGVIKVRVVA